MKFLPLLLIKFYKLAISPYWPGQCRYEPTCSEFTREAIEKHGTLRGLRLGAGRIARCHPGFEGGYDPVPEPALPDQTEHKRGESHAGQPLG